MKYFRALSMLVAVTSVVSVQNCLGQQTTLTFTRASEGNSASMSKTTVDFEDEKAGNSDEGDVGEGDDCEFNDAIVMPPLSDAGSYSWDDTESGGVEMTEEGPETIPDDVYTASFQGQLGGNAAQQEILDHASIRQFHAEFNMNKDGAGSATFESSDDVSGDIFTSITGTGTKWVDIQFSTTVQYGPGLMGATAELEESSVTINVYQKNNPNPLGTISGSMTGVSVIGWDPNGNAVYDEYGGNDGIDVSGVIGFWANDGDEFTYEVKVERWVKMTSAEPGETEGVDSSASGQDSWTFTLDAI